MDLRDALIDWDEPNDEGSNTAHIAEHGLTQEEFSARFRIPLGTLRDWEQGKSEPDQAARAYLTVIARDPEAVRKALTPPPP